MEGIVGTLVVLSCIGAPILVLGLILITYGASARKLRMPGILSDNPGGDLPSAPEFSKKISEIVAGVISLVGGIFGFLGFLLPWLRLDVGAGNELFDIGNFGGSMSGIALAFQSGAAGMNLLTADAGEAAGVASILIFISLLVWGIAFFLAAASISGVGVFSAQLGVIKDKAKILPKVLVAFIIISFCATCTFFSAVQATIGGVKLGGSEGFLGTSMSISAEVATGFWITVGGLLIALFGAFTQLVLAPRIQSWALRISEAK